MEMRPENILISEKSSNFGASFHHWGHRTMAPDISMFQGFPAPGRHPTDVQIPPRAPVQDDNYTFACP